jgi:poly(rC)-binding protein 2/3/4
MSASPTIATSSAKRPLEEPSSPAGPNDQPDAKRPALDKMLREEEPSADDIDIAQPVKAEDIATEGIKEDQVEAALDVADAAV